MKKDVKENVLILKELYERRSEFDEEWKTDIIRDVFHPTFTRQQFILEMVHLQTHKGIEEFYAALFKKFNHLPSSDIKPLFWTYSERANFTLPKPIGMYVGQRGLPPHYDANPWENEYGQTSKAIDLNKERFLENGKRRWEIDRPFQSFIALNDCVGGHTGGGMGLCDKSHLYFAEMRKLPIHGRNPRWGNVTRITQSPTGKWTEHVDKKLYKKVIELHRNILSNMIYPSYKKGDLVIWLREMVHVGPQGNTSNEYQARCYVNKLPRNIRNDNYIKQQAQSLLEGKATHGNFKEEQLTLSKWSDYAKMVYGLETLKNDRTIIIAQEKNKKIIV
ncbi:hypothetical protein SNEBB_005977 [Seison nebaliae]|nr:hypothetical protein SNEBB_005977 [Seison nebaliae]